MTNAAFGGGDRGETIAGARADHNATRHQSTIAADLRRRRAASWRLPVLECGRSDPWHYEPPVNLDGVIAAAEHLLALDLPPLVGLEVCRVLWQSGYRDLAVRLAGWAVPHER